MQQVIGVMGVDGEGVCVCAPGSTHPNLTVCVLHLLGVSAAAQKCLKTTLFEHPNNTSLMKL